MSEMMIRSRFKEYPVRFVDDFTLPLKDEIDNGAFTIVDKTVFDLFRPRLTDLLRVDRFLVIEANETNKTLGKCQAIIENLVARKVRRNQKLLAIGGGVIQDVTAFTASILYRGIEWSFFPTTLLSQADSCIGSKTSINIGDKKNLIGNFYPPSAIYIDTGFLDALTADDIKSGIGEILHFYLYANSGRLKELIDNYQSVIHNRKLLSAHILESLKIKKSVIEVDEFDKDERNKFNYGHTFGHAIESITEFSIKHGQAVTVGMDMANFISLQLGLMSKDVYDGLHSMLSLNFPLFDFHKIDMNRYFDFLSKDKKNIGNNLGCILSSRPGFLFKKQIPINESLIEWIKLYFSLPAGAA
jgi:3-dehydroquinate synthase